MHSHACLYVQFVKIGSPPHALLHALNWIELGYLISSLSAACHASCAAACHAYCDRVTAVAFVPDGIYATAASDMGSPAGASPTQPPHEVVAANDANGQGSADAGEAAGEGMLMHTTVVKSSSGGVDDAAGTRDLSDTNDTPPCAVHAAAQPVASATAASTPSSRFVRGRGWRGTFCLAMHKLVGLLHCDVEFKKKVQPRNEQQQHFLGFSRGLQVSLVTLGMHVIMCMRTHWSNAQACLH